MKPIAYSYIRFSTKDQIRGDSQRRQYDAAKSFCLEKELELYDKPFNDQGVSGYKDVGRPGLDELLKAVEAEKIRSGDYIIIENLDRLSRKGISDTLELLNKILKKGVFIVDLHNNKILNKDSTNDLGAVITIAVAADLAYQESLKRSHRIGSSWQEKQKQALESGKPKTSRCPAWLTLNKNKNEFECIDEKVDIVKRIFDMSLSGIGRRKIRAILNSELVPTLVDSGNRVPKEWHTSTIQKLLSNPAVIGHLVPTKLLNGKRVEDLDAMIKRYYPPIIDEGAFYQCQQARKNNNKTGGRRGKNFTNIFQGFAVCSSCFSSMEYVNKTSRDKYLRCSSYIKKTGCRHNKLWRYKILESTLYVFLKNINLSELNPESKTHELKGVILKKKEQVLQKEKKIKKLIEDFDVDTNKYIKESINDLNAELGTLKISIDELEAKQKADSIPQDLKSDSKKELLNLMMLGDETARAKINSFLRNKVTLTFCEDASTDGELMIMVQSGDSRFVWFTSDQDYYLIGHNKKLIGISAIVEGAYIDVIPNSNEIKLRDHSQPEKIPPEMFQEALMKFEEIKQKRSNEK